MREEEGGGRRDEYFLDGSTILLRLDSRSLISDVAEYSEMKYHLL